MMSLGWDTIKKLGMKRMASELTVIWMGQTSKPVDMIILPSVAVDDQPVPDTRIVVNNQNQYVDGVELGLELDLMCYIIMPLTEQIVIHPIEVVGDSTFWNRKIL